jgi:hypothetical protein
LDHYRRFSFLPDVKEPLDRWFQLPDGRTAAEVQHFYAWARDLAPDVEVIVDPLCGAGSAGVAARNEGLAFRGFDGYPPRALYALAKCQSGDAAFLRELAARPDIADASAALHHVAETRPSDDPLLTIMAACRVASLDIGAGPSFAELLAWIAEDLDGSPSDVDLDVECMDIRQRDDEVFDLRPAVMVTAPPHPLTRGVFRDPDDPVLTEAVEALRRLGRYRSHTEAATAAGLVPAVFAFGVQRFPGLRAAIIEYEDPPGHSSGAEQIIEVGEAYGFRWVETVVTYEATPDGHHQGGGGQVLLRR